MDRRDTTRSQRHRLAVPAVLAGLAFAVPMAAAAGPAVGWHRPSATVNSSDRAEQLIQYVSEAARQLCGSEAAIAPDHPRPTTLLASAPPAIAAAVPAIARPPVHAALPQLIALPPPLC